MGAYDPFADEPDHEAQDQRPDTPWNSTMPAEPASTHPEKNRVRVTLKGGAGHGAPWITIDGANVSDALAQLTGESADTLAQLVAQTAKIGRYFASTGGGPKTQEDGQRQPGKPEAATQAPNGEERYCKHGQMAWRSGVSKAGKAYKGFFCAEQDRDQQCKPQFV